MLPTRAWSHPSSPHHTPLLQPTQYTLAHVSCECLLTLFLSAAHREVKGASQKHQSVLSFPCSTPSCAFLISAEQNPKFLTRLPFVFEPRLTSSVKDSSSPCLSDSLPPDFVGSWNYLDFMYVPVFIIGSPH